MPGAVGVVVAGAVVFVVGLRFGSLPDDDPGEMKRGEAILNNAMSTAMIHVPFSSMSFVCLTPMNCVLKPAILPARPPPFGFWTSMKNAIITEVKMISIRKKIAMSHYFNCSILAAK